MRKKREFRLEYAKYYCWNVTILLIIFDILLIEIGQVITLVF
jgi:hypothetical protein